MPSPTSPKDYPSKVLRSLSALALKVNWHSLRKLVWRPVWPSRSRGKSEPQYPKAKIDPGDDTYVNREYLREEYMNSYKGMHRRAFLSATTATALAAPLIAAGASPDDEAPLPQDILPGDPLAQYWNKKVSHLIDVQPPKELSQEQVKERHRIYMLLLMALVARFWNGNNNGPLGVYSLRTAQKAIEQGPDPKCLRYRGDLNERSDEQHVSWDRYLG